MMQTANFRNRDHLASIRWFNLPWHRSVAIERQMWPGFMVIVEILAQDPEQMGLV